MKRVLVGLLIGAVCFSFAGCGSEIPEMTEEQQELVVEYAAGELLKFDKNHSVKLVELEEPEEEPEEDKAQAAPETEPAKEQQDEEDTSKEQEGISPEDVEVLDQGQESVSIEEFLGLGGAEISYTGFEVADSYPSDMGEEVYFYMDATENSKLLVLKFDLKNTSDAEQAFDLASGGVRYKIAVDGAVQNALTTMLMNDMTYYQGTLASGESTELVVVGEVPASQADQIATLELVMKSVDDTATISLN